MQKRRFETVLKNYNKEGQKLPLFGVGPYMVWGMGVASLIGVILIGYVFKVGELHKPWTIVFRIIGVLLIVVGIAVWFIGAVRSDMDNHIENNKLKTSGIYAWVRNPMYSGWWIAMAGIILLWHNVVMLILLVINWLIMTITLINTEEKWLLDLYGDEYTSYKTKVNRCIPWKPSEDRIYVTEISNARWMAYDLPGNIGWILYIVCLVKCFVDKPSFIASWGLFGIVVLSVIPAVMMAIGVIELISERIERLDRKLPKTRLQRGFGFLTFGGMAGAVISIAALIYGAYIGETELLLIWLMLAGGLLCSIFAGLIYKTYK